MREQRGIFDAVLYKKIINQTGLRNYLYEESAPIFPRKNHKWRKDFHKLVTFTIVHSAELLSETPVYCLLN